MQILLSVKISSTIRNLEILSKVFSGFLYTDSVSDREMVADNLFFILILNNVPEHVRTYISYQSS